jgi:divalent metal cation (Fe/Co/Zn/Cd) transporter
MPLLARGRLRIAASLGSLATTLLGLGSNALLGWWWADPVAALAMLPLIVREGLEAWRGEAGESEDA